MTNEHDIIDTTTLKAQAKRLKAALEKRGVALAHGQSLDLIAAQRGFRDWNTLKARTPEKRPLQLGARVKGRYLVQAFEGRVEGIARLAKPGWLRVTLRFDRPVDVVRFEGLSNLRRQVSAVIGPDGATVEKTSDGRPQLVIDA